MLTLICWFILLILLAVVIIGACIIGKLEEIRRTQAPIAKSSNSSPRRYGGNND